ncbi:MAG: hypothetical protein ACJAT2_000420 [Bacteriovoracaceae bacterium]|jgi:hypothetical protein
MVRKLEIKLTLITLGLSFFVSCSSDVEDKNEAVSSFENTPVQLVGSTVNKSMWSDSAWNDIPNSTYYKFQTCLKDKAINNPIIDEAFQIESPTGTKQVLSNIDGCLIWNERVEFNYLEQERLINYPIKIHGLGHYKGSRSFDLALNPWPGAQKPMVFLKNETDLSDSFGVFELNEKSDLHSLVESNLQTEGLSFSTRPISIKEGVKHYPIDVEFKALLLRKGLSGESAEKLRISTGRFKAIFNLFEIADTNNENATLISSIEKEVTAKNSLFQENLDFYFKGQTVNSGNSYLFLEIELIPINGPKELASELLRVTDFDIESGRFGTAKTIKEKTKAILRVEADLPDPTDREVIGEELDGDDKLGYYIKKVKDISRGSIVNNSYNKSSIKVRRAKFTICLNEETGSSDQVPLTDTQVKVDIKFEDGKSDGAKTERIYKTNEEGCINTFANITYDKYSLERWIPFNVTVTPLDGTYTDLIKTRKLTVNPWNPEDFGYDTKYETEIPQIKARAPRLFVGKVDYTKETMDYSQFRINEFLHLSLKRKYQFVFEPKVELFHSYKDDSVTESLSFGNFKVKVSLFSPNSPDVDYYNPDLKNFKFITSSAKEMKIQANGVITDLISFPFLVSETQNLAKKNLAILEISTLEEGSAIRPVRVVFPFFGANKGASMPSFPFDKEISKDLITKIESTIKEGKKLPVIDVDSDPASDPMAYFVQTFTKKGKEINPSMIIKNHRLEEFNKSAPIAPWERIKLPKGQSLKEKVALTNRELRTLVTENVPKMPRGIISKFCRHFYKLPTVERKTENFQRVDVLAGSDAYVHCSQNPNEHFSITPVTHIRRILSRKVENQNEAFASFVDSERGQVSRGNAFFAAYGDRASSVTGERQSEARTTNLSYGIEGPGPYYFGYSRGHVKEYATFEQKNSADMEAAFDRFYTQRQLSELIFDQLTLKFYAQVRRCVTVVGTQSKATRIHLCEEQDRPKQIEEDWFFIGDTRSQDHGIIADGAFAGVTGFTQVIRGKFNYNRMWNKYKTDDIKQVLEEVGDHRGMSYAFERFLGEDSSMPYENFVDNSHPGLYITPRY